MHVNVLIDIVIFHLYVANVSHKGAVHPKKIKHKKYIVVIPDLSKINTFGGEILSMKSMKTKVVLESIDFHCMYKSSCNIPQNIFFCFPQKKESQTVFENSKFCQNFPFWVNYPLNMYSVFTEYITLCLSGSSVSN